MLESQKSEVLSYAKMSYQQKLFAGTSGNLSVYDRETGLVAITPSCVPYETMSLEDIVVIDMEGNAAECKGNVNGDLLKPSSEWKLHVALYKAFEECNAVVHTHSPYATSFAATHETIPFVLVEMMLFLGGDIPVAEFAVNGSAELGDNVAAVLKNRKACLMANHGVAAIGENLKKAHIAAVYTEDVAKIYSIARTHGDVKLIGKDVEAFMRKKYGF